MGVPLSEIVWPDLSGVAVGGLSALMDQLDEIQFHSPRDREEAQYRQLAQLARFAIVHSPHFCARMAEACLRPDDLATPADLRRLPVLARRDLQQDMAAMDCRAFAPRHGPFATTQTSGSSGEPVIVHRGGVSRAFWMANTLREHLWHKRDFAGTLAVIRANLSKKGPAVLPNWGAPAALLYKTGPCHAMPVNADIAIQVRWLNEVDPDYLLVYPNNLAALLDEADAGKLQLHRLRQLRSIGETLSPALRTRTEVALGVDVADCYSSQELGSIAVQCPVRTT